MPEDERRFDGHDTGTVRRYLRAIREREFPRWSDGGPSEEELLTLQSIASRIARAVADGILPTFHGSDVNLINRCGASLFDSPNPAASGLSQDLFDLAIKMHRWLDQPM